MLLPYMDDSQVVRRDLTLASTVSKGINMRAGKSIQGVGQEHPRIHTIFDVACRRHRVVEADQAEQNLHPQQAVEFRKSGARRRRRPRQVWVGHVHPHNASPNA